MRSRASVGALLALALSTIGTPALAQRSEPGWIGISYEIRSSSNRFGRGEQVVITDVRRGSPAEESGLRPGDRILRINDVRRAGEFQDLPERLRLRVGDRVRIRVDRGGRDIDFQLRAAQRPGELRAEGAFQPAIQSDSMVETMFRAMDSLRLHLVEASAQTVRTLRPPGATEDDITVVAGTSRVTVPVPFEFFVFRGEEHDSLRREMEELNRAIVDLRTRERDRLREIRAASSASRSRVEGQDGQLVRLRTAIEDVTRQSAVLRSAMAEAARATAGLDYTWGSDDSPPAALQDVRPFRPLTPYLMGSNRVAGAQVVDLGPELAEYFAVEGGVLIVDVAPRTPAATAGMLPGDVVTRLDQVGVRTVQDLRVGVSQAGETLPITVVRRGTSIEVLLRR